MIHFRRKNRLISFLLALAMLGAPLNLSTANACNMSSQDEGASSCKCGTGKCGTDGCCCCRRKAATSEDSQHAEKKSCCQKRKAAREPATNDESAALKPVDVNAQAHCNCNSHTPTPLDTARRASQPDPLRMLGCASSHSVLAVTANHSFRPRVHAPQCGLQIPVSLRELYCCWQV